MSNWQVRRRKTGKLQTGLLLAATIFSPSSMAAHVVAAETRGENGPSSAADVAQLWSRFAEVNKAWLDPHPRQLRYVAIGEVNKDDLQGVTINRVWVSGRDVRWEMDSDPPRSAGEPRLAYTVVSSGGSEVYLRAPHESMLNRPRQARDFHALRQGITWQTAVHAIDREGLPADARIVSRTPDGDGEIVALEMKLAASRSQVGLGFYHLHYGQVGMPIGRVRLHIRLPSHVPVKEEYLDGQVTIEYDPAFVVLGDGLAPTRIRHVSQMFDGKPWALEGQFQTMNGEWLLDKALNIQDGKVIAEMKVSNVSTVALDPSLFELVEDRPSEE